MATSYGDVLGTGDRRERLLGLSTTGAFINLPTDLIDGETDEGTCSFVNGQLTSGYEIRFDFRGLCLIDEARFWQSTSVTHGVWEWQGSLDGTTWTPIGSFVLGGATNPQIHDVWHGNLTPYQHVRLKGLSGTVSTSILFEIEFRCDHTVGDPATNARTTQDVAEVAVEPELPAVRNTTDTAEIAFERDPEYVLVRDTTDAVEAAIETYPVVRVTQDVIECVITPPKGSVPIVPPLPMPLQQQVYDERFLMTEPWRGFFTALLTEKPAAAGFMERIGKQWRRRVTRYAEDTLLPDYPLPLQQPVIDERRLITEPWRGFFNALVKKFQEESLPLPVQQTVTDDRLLMTVPWAMWFLWLLSRRTAGGGDIEEFMPDIVFMDSFDHYGTNDLHMKYALANEGLAHIAPGLGRNGTNALGVAGQNDNENFLRLGRFPARDTYYLEFGFNANSNAGAPPPGHQIVAFRDSGIPQVELRLVATGQLAVTRNGVVLGQSSGIAIGTNTWRHLGFYAKISNSLGEITVTLDSIPIPELTLTGVDTQNSVSARITEAVFFSQSNNNGIASYYDDIILSKDGFCSDSRVTAVFPKGDGFWQQWIQAPNAYTYPQGSGNRVADIVITQNATAPLLSGTLSTLVDGNTASNIGCAGIAVDATKFIRFDFGTGRHITEVRLLWGNFREQGTWLWQGSGDGAAWTDLMTAPFTLGGISGNLVWQTIKLTSGLFFRYYRLRGVDGSPASAGFNELHEVEFYIDPGAAPPPLYQNVDERDSNGDDDYNWSKTAGHRVSYDFQSLNMTGTIKGVQHVATMRKDDDRVRIVNLFTRVGGVDFDGPDISVNDTYVAQRQVWVKNPATDLPWEVAEVDSSEWGEKLVS